MGVGEVGGFHTKGYVAYTRTAENAAAASGTAKTPTASANASREINDSVSIFISKDSGPRSAESIKFLDLLRQLTDARKQGDDYAKSLDTLRKCIVIAMRIIEGDKVPMEDHRFLMENEPEMYYKALMMRRIKEDPDEYDRISEDEEEEEQAFDSAAAGRAAVTELAAVVSDSGADAEASPEPE